MYCTGLFDGRPNLLEPDIRAELELGVLDEAIAEVEASWQQMAITDKKCQLQKMQESSVKLLPLSSAEGRSGARFVGDGWNGSMLEKIERPAIFPVREAVLQRCQKHILRYRCSFNLWFGIASRKNGRIQGVTIFLQERSNCKRKCG